MSPTYFIVLMTAAEKRLEGARKAGDIRSMQMALAEITELCRSYYGEQGAEKAS